MSLPIDNDYVLDAVESVRVGKPIRPLVGQTSLSIKTNSTQPPELLMSADSVILRDGNRSQIELSDEQVKIDGEILVNGSPLTASLVYATAANPGLAANGSPTPAGTVSEGEDMLFNVSGVVEVTSDSNSIAIAEDQRGLVLKSAGTYLVGCSLLGFPDLYGGASAFEAVMQVKVSGGTTATVPLVNMRQFQQLQDATTPDYLEYSSYSGSSMVVVPSQWVASGTTAKLVISIERAQYIDDIEGTPTGVVGVQQGTPKAGARLWAIKLG